MSAFIDACLAVLAEHGVECAPGLTDAELERVESQFGFRFAADHRELLARALPTGESWVDWRHGPAEALRGRLDWPLDSMLFDVRSNVFWPASWGRRPDAIDDAMNVARQNYERWPQLVPVYSHRYLPAAPVPSGSPVFSVYQTDVIFYGADLLDYLRREFAGARLDGERVSAGALPPWSQLAFGVEAADL